MHALGAAAPPDERLAALSDWLTDVLGARPRLAPASADASFRRYFRVLHGEARYIAMDAPPPREDVRPYLDVAARLRAAGLNAPRVHAADVARGFVLLDDFGDLTYQAALGPATAEALYADALEALLRMQTAVDADGLPPYDEALLRAEMGLFDEWYLGRHLGRRDLDGLRARLAPVHDRLVAAAFEQPRVFVHRDYHARNLMVRPAPGNPGLLDFQDAVRGPVTYDLVSLLEDCYVRWPPERVRRWALTHHRRLCAAGVLAVDAATFLRWFDWMGVQRHLKAAGIFARLYHRDGKPGYLADLGRTLAYLYETAAAYPELAPLAVLLARITG